MTNPPPMPRLSNRPGAGHPARRIAGFPLLALLLVICGLLLSLSCGRVESGGGCRGPADQERKAELVREPGKMLAVCTTGLVADLVRQVGGPHVQAVSLTGPADDPHRYRLTRDDRDLLAKADMIFMNGLHLEAAMERDLEEAGRERTLVDIGKNLHPTFLRRPADYGGDYDPHIWMETTLWLKAIVVVQRALSRADSVHSSAYRERGESFQRELGDLTAWAVETVKAVPAERRIIVTAHDAFGYFGQEFLTETHSLQGISTASPYTREEVEQLAAQLVRRGVQVVFAEAGAPPGPLEELMEVSRARGHELRVGGTLYADNLGDSGTPAGDYLGMFRHNVTTYTEAVRQEGPGEAVAPGSR